MRRDREVLHQTGKVAEPEVDDLDPFIRGKADDLSGATFLHFSSPSPPHPAGSSNEHVKNRTQLSLRPMDAVRNAAGCRR